MAARGESEGGRSADESEIEIPRRSAGRGVAVALVLLLDAGLVVSGGVMIRDHFARGESYKPETGSEPGRVKGTFTETGTDPGTGGAGRDAGGPPVSGSVPVSVNVPLPLPGPVPVSDAQVQAQKKPAPKPVPPARLPDRKEPAQLPGRPDAGILGAPISRPDAAPFFPSEPDAAPPEPDAAEPEVADAAVEESDARGAPQGPDPWVESMTRGIRDVVESHRDAIEDCYRRAAKEWTSADPLAGRLDVHLKIVASGDAEDVRVVENRTGSAALGSCLVTVMSTWRYPAPGDEAMEFIWPFNFKSAMPE